MTYNIKLAVFNDSEFFLYISLFVILGLEYQK